MVCTVRFFNSICFIILTPFFPLQNAVCFIILTYLVSVLFTFYIQGVLKFKKKNNSSAKRLSKSHEMRLQRCRWEWLLTEKFRLGSLLLHALRRFALTQNTRLSATIQIRPDSAILRAFQRFAACTKLLWNPEDNVMETLSLNTSASHSL